MSGEKTITCIVCPVGCELHVQKINDEWKITGNKCPRGIPYAMSEMTQPVRTLTTTVKIDGWIYPVISVKTSRPVPKDKLFEIMDEISKASISAPVKMGDVVIENVLGLGVDVVVTRDSGKV